MDMEGMKMQPSSSRRGLSRGRIRQSALTALGILLIILVAACGTPGSSPAGGGAGAAGASAEPPNEEPASGGSGQPGGGSGQPGGVPFAELVDRKIVKTGEITVQVGDVGVAVGQVRAMAVELSGYVGDSRLGGQDEPATLTLRIPANRFEEALQRLRDMDGEVKVEATGEEDVTSSIVDLEARIRNLQASEQQYRALVERAEKVDDILSVQSRLDEVRGQIEQHRAQLEQLSGLAALSTLTVTLVPVSRPIEVAAEGWDPGATAGSALGALVSAGQQLTDVLIWLSIVGLPLALVIGVVVVVAARLGPTFRRRLGPVPAGEEQHPGNG
jgi:hypothetical protein